MGGRESRSRMMSRRSFLARLALAGTATSLLAACQPAPAAPPPPAPTTAPASKPTAQAAPAQPKTGAAAPAPTANGRLEEWERVVEAAKREGELNIYSAVTGAEGRTAVVEAFEKAYPTIKVSAVSAPNTDLVARVAAERTAGKFIADVLVGPGNSAIPLFKPDGGLAPIKPLLILPEVADESLWLNGHHWFLDAAEPYVAMGFQGQLQPVISRNTQLVDENELNSYWDVVNPKWKGKIISRDVRTPGPGGPQAIYQYRHPDLGPAFIERLFGEMDVKLSVDARQMIDWLAQGQAVIGYSINSRELRDAGAQGLPVAWVSPRRFKEGADLTNAGGTFNVMAQAPHPNAAKLYVNWLLSREGQISWQKLTNTPSARIDIPKDELDPSIVPDPKATYPSSSVEQYGGPGAEQEVRGLITRALEKGGKPSG